MIPHRSLGREYYEEGVNYRVVACRKRLRTVRSQLGAQIAGETASQLDESEKASLKRDPEPEPTFKRPGLG